MNGSDQDLARDAGSPAPQKIGHRAAVDSLARFLTLAGNRAYPELRRAGWQTDSCGVPDVLAMKRFAYGPTTWRLDAYEVKVNAGDLRSDVRAGKWHRYVTELGCRFVWFALATTETQVLAKEVPPECGVTVRSGEKWITKRTPRSLQNDLRKVHPMLLVAMMDNPPYEVGDPWERYHRQQRFIENALGMPLGATHEWDYNKLRSAARSAGVAIRGALAQPDRSAAAIHEWALQLLQEWAKFYGKTAEELKAEVEHGHFFDNVTADALRGLVFERQRSRLANLLAAAEIAASGNDFDGDWHRERVKRGDDLAREVMEATSRSPRTSRARRGVVPHDRAAGRRALCASQPNNSRLIRTRCRYGDAERWLRACTPSARVAVALTPRRARAERLSTRAFAQSACWSRRSREGRSPASAASN